MQIPKALAPQQKPWQRTEFFGQPINCAMNTSVCLSLQGSDISMSLRPSFYEAPGLAVQSVDTQQWGGGGAGAGSEGEGWRAVGGWVVVVVLGWGGCGNWVRLPLHYKAPISCRSSPNYGINLSNRGIKNEFKRTWWWTQVLECAMLTSNTLLVCRVPIILSLFRPSK